MKWAIIGIIALIVLGAIGYAVYELTSAPEDAQAWWDEKKLENFPTQAKREIADMQDHLDQLKKTREDLQVASAKLEGGEGFNDANYSKADTGFMTLYGYNDRIKKYNETGEYLGKTYKDAAAAPNAEIDADSGKLSPDAKIAVNFTHPKTGREVNDELTAANIIKILDNIGGELDTMEYERDLVKQSISEYGKVIADVDKTIKAQENAIKEFKQEVTKIEAQLKIIKVKEDLAEINKAINGEQSDSELGQLIAQYEKKKKDFAARQKVAESSTSDMKSLDDLGKAGPGESSGAGSRFLK